MTEDVKVLIIDDHPLFRAALEVALLKSEIEPSNVQSVSNVTDALECINKNKFDLLLLDLNMSDSKGFEGLSKIRAAEQSSSVIIVSATETTQAYQTAKSLGASGYIPKSTSLADITTAIKLVLTGKTSFPKNISEQEHSNSTAAQKLAAAERYRSGMKLVKANPSTRFHFTAIQELTSAPARRPASSCECHP